MEEIIESAVSVLQSGMTLLYPTDTIWGIGCDARRADAVEKLYGIKERDRAKSMLVLIAEWGAESAAWRLEDESRPTTYILPGAIWRPMLGGCVADNLPAADGSLGIRVPDHPFCQEVLRRLGAPLVSTSANFSGKPSPSSYEDIDPALKMRVDMCVPNLPELAGKENRGSRIVKVNGDGTLTVIRQ